MSWFERATGPEPRREYVTARGDSANTESSTSTSIPLLAAANSRQLVQANPTAEWEGIVKRLNCAIPLFRLENALARHLDPRDVKAPTSSRPSRKFVISCWTATTDEPRSLFFPT